MFRPTSLIPPAGLLILEKVIIHLECELLIDFYMCSLQELFLRSPPCLQAI